MTSRFRWILGIFISIAFAFKGAFGLRDVKLTIEPRIVQRTKNAVLRCQYDLEGDPLYYVKWFRGQHEFYRYRPHELPRTKVFPIGGISVDESRSNSTQVVLQDIQFNLAGNFTCEVTTTNIQTGEDTQTMMVVDLPKQSPTIRVIGEPFDYGHTLRANCFSPPSVPPAKLKFTLNNITVPSTPLSDRKSQEMSGSDSNLELKLSEFHFNNGRLILRCVAQVHDIYYEEAELELDSARNPTPERVRSSGRVVSACGVLTVLASLCVLLVRNSSLLV